MDDDGSEGRRWVVAPDGRCGLSDERRGQSMLVQFGSGGPFEWWSIFQLREATAHEIAVMEGSAS
jgi:hypothetical protein